MEPVETIAPEEWMTAGPARQVVEVLRAAGAEARFVGGCVRDTLAHRPVKDIDIATDAVPERVLALLNAAGIKAVATGLEHGTVTAVIGKRAFEITTLRRDVETFGRHATVAFTRDWTADAARRDLTINAMSLTPEGLLYDPFGGRADLLAGVIRFVGQAAQRIREDYLRILRFFRFLALYGRVAPDPETLAAIEAELAGIESLSGERLRSELLKLMAARDPAPALELMVRHGVLARLLPQPVGLSDLIAVLGLERAFGVEPDEPDALVRLAALLPSQRDGAIDLARRMRFSNQESQRLALLVAPPVTPSLPASAATLRVLCYRTGRSDALAICLLAAARQRVSLTALTEALDVIHDWDDDTRLPLSGEDLLALGVAPGPEMGRLLKKVEDWWIAEDFRPDKAACVAKSRELLAVG
ncbi:CCA tRNA nucleotidyltransferase [Limibacillus halophilus]|uniref:Poly(A) polymerase n=1 Tax=Limibacillus halophilus TaxID=1579333 RepID=A0A839SSX8_9PROT|nr:CCA tRNA nucleotidyltransferase [Limibacillus halophilus]MBB3065967.1 poly(A) polymerase [Limibacillus halophilus]